jgi:predicted Zn-dependent protease
MSAPLGLLPLMRAYEEEADRIAVRTMARAGYDPTALFRYIERMQVGERLISDSSRPSREARVAGLQQAVAELSPSQYASGTGKFERIRALVSALMQQAPPAPSLR